MGNSSKRSLSNANALGEILFCAVNMDPAVGTSGALQHEQGWLQGLQSELPYPEGTSSGPKH